MIIITCTEDNSRAEIELSAAEARDVIDMQRYASIAHFASTGVVATLEAGGYGEPMPRCEKVVGTGNCQLPLNHAGGHNPERRY